MFLWLAKKMEEVEGITESLKVINSMELLRKINNIRNRAIEMVNNQIIFA